MSEQDSQDVSAVHAVWAEPHGAVLMALRRSRGLRQVELAELVQVPRSMVSNWETGTRRPSLDQLQRLVAALNVPAVTFLAGVEAAGGEGPDGGRQVPGPLASALEVVPEVERPDLARFLRQVRVFEQRGRAADMVARRWSSVRVLGQEAREELERVSTFGQNAGTRQQSGIIGKRLAQTLRARLTLGEAPLPSTEAVAELMGVHVFRNTFGPTPSGRLSGVLIESETIGAAVLLNVSLTATWQRVVLAELVARAVLQVPGAMVSVASRPRTPVGNNVDVAAAAFASEFVLPAYVLDLDFELFRSRHRDMSTPDVVRAVVGVARVFDVPASVVQRNAQVTLTPDEAHDINRAMNLARARSDPRREGQAKEVVRNVHPDDLPQRLLHQLLDAMDDGTASLGGVCELTGLAPADVEVLMQSQSTTVTREALDDQWSDLWRPDVA